MKAVVCFLLIASAANALAPEPGDPVAILRQRLTSPQPEGVSVFTAQQKLGKILTQPEFLSSSGSPSAWDTWKQRAAGWLAKRLRGLFKTMAQHPVTTEVISWAVALGTLGFICVLLFRLFRNEEKALSTASAVSIGPGQEVRWLKEARLAADRGELNKGIQCLYWAGVTFLQNTRVLPRSSGLTPRELARAADATHIGADFRSLTSSFEQFWYARSPATLDDFAACLRFLRALGCHTE